MASRRRRFPKTRDDIIDQLRAELPQAMTSLRAALP